MDKALLWFTANRIYQPAYLSLETAFSYHGLIPEGVYTLTSVSPRKTQEYHTPLGTFRYRHLLPRLYFGYDVLQARLNPARLADYQTLFAHQRLNQRIQALLSALSLSHLA